MMIFTAGGADTEPCQPQNTCLQQQHLPACGPPPHSHIQLHQRSPDHPQTGVRCLQCIPEDSNGLPDLVELEQALQAHAAAPLLLGSFTAGSSITGITPDVHALARVMHAHGGYAVFDYASAAPSTAITCSHGVAPEDRLDAVVLCPHKFPGGPGGQDVLVIRDAIIDETRPQVAGAEPLEQKFHSQSWGGRVPRRPTTMHFMPERSYPPQSSKRCGHSRSCRLIHEPLKRTPGAGLVGCIIY